MLHCLNAICTMAFADKEGFWASDSTSLSSSDEEVLLLDFISKKKRKRKQRYWVHDILKKRKTHGEFNLLHEELVQDREKFYEYYHMSVEEFEHLYTLVKVSTKGIYKNKDNHEC